MSNDNPGGIILIVVVIGFVIYHAYLGVKAIVNYIGSMLNNIVDMVARFFIPL